MLDVPMYFVYRDGRYIDASGQSFRDFLAGRLPALPGEIAADRRLGRPYDDGLPRGRLKTFLEMRGADGGPWRRLCALPALWVGLSLRHRGARRGLRPDCRLDRGGARENAPRRAADRPRDPASQPHLARHRPRNARNRPRRAASPGPPRQLAARTRRISSTRSSRSPAPAAPRPKNCSKISAPAGAATSTASTRNTRTEAGRCCRQVRRSQAPAIDRRRPGGGRRSQKLLSSLRQAGTHRTAFELLEHGSPLSHDADPQLHLIEYRF